MGAVFDSMQTFFKSPTGCVKADEKLVIRIKIQKNYEPSDVEVVFYEFYSYNEFSLQMRPDGETEEEVTFVLETEFDQVNTYQYDFSFINGYGEKLFIKRVENSFEGRIQREKEGGRWQLTVYTEIETHPNMLKGVMYQIFPDRFAKDESVFIPKQENRLYRKWGEKPYYEEGLIGKDFFGGNLRGIIQKLGYLKSLGVTTIYLNPIWLAHTNHRYDPGDYKVVDPLLGTEEDLKEFNKEAHKSGMIVILDTVLNHTGANSVYFNRDNTYQSIGAYNSPQSPYYDWYYFTEYPYKYLAWWGFVEHPKINQESKTFQEYMFGKDGVIDYWYSLGIDGMRLDVPDELPNKTLQMIYEASKRNRKRIVIIGEVWEDASNKVSYGHHMKYLLGQELTSVMNYPVRDAILAYIRYGGDHWSKCLEVTLMEIFIENYPRTIAYSLMNFLSTHDTVRAITKLAGPEVDDHDRNWQSANDDLSREEYLLGRKRLVISYLLLYFVPGIPSVFYGDEVGLEGQKDPFCRKCYNWNRRDKKLLKIFRKLGKLRKTEERFFQEADFKVIKIDDRVCIIMRKTAERTMILIINRSSYAIDINHYNILPNSTKMVFATGKSKSMNYIEPYEGVILEI